MDFKRTSSENENNSQEDQVVLSICSSLELYQLFKTFGKIMPVALGQSKFNLELTMFVEYMEHQQDTNYKWLQNPNDEQNCVNVFISRLDPNIRSQFTLVLFLQYKVILSIVDVLRLINKNLN